MRTHFDPEESEEFEAARELLIRRCAAWAAEHGLPADELILSVALDARHESVDGRLGHWTPQEVRYTLLDLIPGQVTAPAQELAGAPRSLMTLLRYLADSGLRDPRGATLAELEEAVVEAAAEYPGVLMDMTRWGLAKFWAMTALEHGVDLTDGRSFARFRRDLDAGRVRYDQEALDRLVERQMTEPRPDRERAFIQLPVSMPSGSELAEAAGDSVAVRRLVSVAGWAGTEGRELTGAGNLRLRDARSLAELLGTGEQELTVRTATDMPETDLLLTWAKKARLVRVSRGRLLRVAKAAPLLRDPLALWRRAFETFFEVGRAVCAQPGWAPVSLLSEIFEEIMDDVLNSVYGMPAPMPVVRLRETVWLACSEYLWFSPDEDDLRHDAWRARVDRDLDRALAVLAELGAVELSHGVADEAFSEDLREDFEAQEGVPRPLPPEVCDRLRAALAESGPLVRLAPIGAWAMRERMLARGRDVPVVGELAGAAPAEMLGVVAQHYSEETARLEIEGWLAAHGGDLEPLLQAVRDCPFLTRASAMLNILAGALDDGPELLRRLRSDPVLGPAAVEALITAGELRPEDLTDHEQMLMLAAGLLALLELGGPEAVREQLTAAAGRDAPELAEAVLRSGHPARVAMEEFRTLVAGPMRIRHPSRPTRVSAPGSRGRPTGRGRKRKR
ncbi:hypothetical protein [Planobispora takensis]|uniref:Uncharacterized protein n=1 Tax=Planobispora takensis TaxID=1367882 RepID=A0A8J3SW15_9ACTN|nr:hypothetical protein [Planobispora takensis]GIH99837.1 hypothetical protein Pta02_18460 [Planobispora takensis]